MDNSIDFLWKYYRGESAYLRVDVTKNEDLLHIRIRNSNSRNVQVLQHLNEIFNFDMSYGSKQDVHVINRGMLGDAMKQILSLEHRFDQFCEVSRRLISKRFGHSYQITAVWNELNSRDNRSVLAIAKLVHSIEDVSW